MQLHALLRQFDPQLPLTGIPNVEINGVREDSRLVQPGDLFIARAGTKADGHQVRRRRQVGRGAVAVVTNAKIAELPAAADRRARTRPGRRRSWRTCSTARPA